MKKLIQSTDYAGKVRTLTCPVEGPCYVGDVILYGTAGEEYRLSGGQAPHNPDSSGRVYVRPTFTRAAPPYSLGSSEESYFPHVFGLKWV